MTDDINSSETGKSFVGEDHIKTARMRLQRQEYDQAVQSLRSHLEKAPEDQSALSLIADALTHLQDFKSALPYRRKLAELNPQDDMALNALGVNLLMLNQLQDALIYLTRAVDLSPNSALHQGNLGKLKIALNDHANAAIHLAKALELTNGQDEDLMSALGVCHKHINRKNAAPASAREAKHYLFDAAAGAAARLLEWLGNNGWAGYDPYDVKALALINSIQGKISPEDRQRILQRDLEDPGAARRELGIQPAVNAKAMGLILSSLLLLEDSLGRSFSDWKDEIHDWLIGNFKEGMSGMGWGYPFDWESVVIIPAGTPTGVNSYHVGDAFWIAYHKTGEQKWLDYCASIAEFMANDLNQDHLSEDALCFSYTPLDFYHVHNANLTAAEWLARIGGETGTQKWVDLADKAVNFAMRDLREQGYLTYWAKGFEPGPENVGQMDHYHAAAELRQLYRLIRRLPHRTDIKNQFERYLDLYLKHFFSEEGLTKIHPNASHPVDIHAAAEAAYILGEVMLDYPAALETAQRFLPWFLNNCQNEDGSFIYKIYRVNAGLRTEAFPFLRWGQAWSLRGLASLLAGFSGKSQGGLV